MTSKAHRKSTRPQRKRKPADGLAILRRRYYEGRPERTASLDEARANDAIGRKIFELRSAAGLSQRELADLVGTTPSVICRLENAEYEKHTLTMLRRIAVALNRRVRVEFVPVDEAG